MAAGPFRTDHAPVPGSVERVAPGVRAVTAANAGPMTFTGTRSYIVGEGEVAVIDPGPEDSAHLRALMAALEPGERVAAILVTHSHADHSPLARPLAAATGAPIMGFGPHGAGMSAAMSALLAEGAELGGGEGADQGFRPDRLLSEGESVEGPGWALTALYMPGHLSNHLCYALEGTGIILSGDHVMGWATTLVSPPEGDLTAFMASLRRLATLGPRLLLPGHGAPVTEPAPLIAHILAHREGRERDILDALAEGPGDVAGLVRRIYAAVDPRLHGAAGRNVLAHLLDLAGRGLVAAEGRIGPAARFRRTPRPV